MKQIKLNAKKKNLTLNISVALLAGVFSIMPVAEGAPTGGSVLSGGADISDTKNITSTTQNNVISWQDFSVANGETVKFDNGEKTNNYLNIVRGAATSQIDGAIQGGKDVYIVNPNGVVFGKASSVDVGNLYVSTRYISDEVAKNAAEDSNLTSVFNSTDKSLAADVVNLGKISATNVVAEGKNIRFIANDVKANNVELRAYNAKTVADAKTDIDCGYIHVGTSNGTAAANYVAKATNEDTASDNSKITWYKTVTADNIQSELSSNTGGNFMLTGDVKLDGNTTNNWTPITDFSGNFDGMFYTIQNANISIASAAGIFGTTNGARIENLGVVNSSITNTTKSKPWKGAGALVGEATSTILKNVYNKDSSVIAANVVYAGGIAGEIIDTQIIQSYTTGEKSKTNGGGIIGYSNSKNNYIKDCYSTGETGNDNKYGIFVSANDKSTVFVENSYTTNLMISSNVGSTVKKSFVINNNIATLIPTNTNYENGANQKATYKAAKWDISDTGGVSIDADGNVTKATWRIYGNSSTPLLTAFFKGTTAVNYDYTMGSSVSGNNGGSDLTKTYNGNAIDLSNVTFSSNAVESNITYKTTKDKTADRASSESGTYAQFTSGQQGYDIAGGNITIVKRQVNANIDTDFKPKKEYDGTSAVTVNAVAGALTGTGESDSGLIDGDEVSLSGTVSGTYYSDEAHQNKTSSVGKGLYGTINFSDLTLTGEAAANYELTINGDQNKDISFTGGEITPKALTLTTDSDNRLTKVYDGTTAITGNVADAIAKLSVNGVVGNEAVSVVGENDATAEYDEVNAGTRNLIINGLTLSGDTAENYYLKDSDGNVIYDPTGYFGTAKTVANNVTATNAGLITPRVIDKTSFQVYDKQTNKWVAGTKVYDNTSAYSYSDDTKLSQAPVTTGEKGILAADIDKIKFAITGAKFTTADGNEAVDATDSGLKNAATRLAYTVSITGTDDKVLGNYTFDTTSTENSTTLKNTSTADVSGAGTITKRTIILTGQNATGLDKVYDGTDELADTYTKWGNDYAKIVYDSNSNSDTLVTGDGTSVSLTGKYADKNVAYDTSGKVTTKNVTYTASLSGDKAANYDLKTTTITKNSDGSAITGTITTKILDVNIGDVTKVYDGTTAVTAAMLDGKVTLDGLINGDKVTVDTADTAKNAAYNSANVSEANKVTYTGISLGGDDAKNYSLNSSTVIGSGEITKKSIASADDLVWTVNDKLTKIYDGDNALKSTPTTNNLSLSANGVTGSDSLSYTLVDSSSHYDDANSNNGASQGITYTITLNDSSGNYDIAANTKFTKNVADAGIITPRIVYVNVNDNKLSREYDATTDVTNAKNYINIATTNSTTGFINTDSNALNVTGTFDNKNAGTDKTVNYALSLSGDSAGNYNLVQQGTNTTVANLTGTGDITKHKLALTINNVTKTYDTTANVDADSISSAFGANDKVTANEDDFSLDTSNVTGSYGKLTNATFTADANAGKDKDVQYTNLSTLLTGTNAQNYELTWDGATLGDTAYGKGTIDKLTIDSSSGWNFNFDFGGLTKVYDNTKTAFSSGSENLGKNYVSLLNFSNKNNNKTIDLTESYDVKNVSYDSVNAGSRAVTYTIQLNGDFSNNYDLSGLTNITGVNFDSTTNQLTKTINQAGTIEQRKVYVSAQNTPAVSKIYDGTTDLPTGTDTASHLIVADKTADSGLLGTDKVSWTSTSGRYVDANAGTNKEIHYDVALTNDNNNNYVLVDGTGNALATENNTSYVKGLGDITKRNLYLNFTNPVKTYDGSTYAVVNVTTEAATNDTGLVNGDKFDNAKVNGEYGTLNNGSFTASPNAGSDKVKYTGLTAALGNKSGNYTIYAKDSTATAATEVTDSSYIGGGTINKLKLDNTNFKYQLATANKIYNGDKLVSHLAEDGTTEITADSNIKSLTVTLKQADSSAADKVENLKYTLKDAVYAGSDANTYTNGVNYTLKLTDLTNFELDDKLAVKPGSDEIQLTGNGTIDKRKISVDFADVNKVYDGTKAVTNVDNCVINPTINAQTELGKQVIASDGLKLDASKLTGQYDTANAGSDKTVTYSGITAALNSDKADVLKNYDFADTATGNGSIDKAKLTINVNGKAERAYNGDSLIDLSHDYTNGNKISFTLNGVSSETITINDGDTGFSTIEGNFGNYSQNDDGTSTFTNDANVNTDSNGKVTGKAVQYKNFTTLLSGLDGDWANNYTIDDSISFTADDNRGQINKLQITNDNLSYSLLAANKIYNGNNLVSHLAEDGTTENKAQDNIQTLSVTLTHADGSKTTEDLKYDLSKAVYNGSDADIYNNGVNYTLKLTDLNNFALADDLSVRNGNDELTLTGDGAIAKRKITVNFADVNKVYDGTNAVTNVDNCVINPTINAQTELGKQVIASDGLTIDTSKLTGQYDTAKAGNDKTVTYTGITNALNATDNNVLKNYDFADTATGNGSIDKAKLTINVSGKAERDYNGNSSIDLSRDYTNGNEISFTLDGVNNETITISNGATGFNTIEGNFGNYSQNEDGSSTFTDDANVNRDSSGQVTSKAVQYKNFTTLLDNLGGDWANNYTIDDSISFSASDNRGQINPYTIDGSTLTYDYTQANKMYDGTDTVKNATSYLNAYVIAPSGKTKLIYTADGSYTNGKNVGTGGVTYTINSVSGLADEDLNNYNFAADTLKNQLQSAVLAGRDDGTIVGTITPRVIKTTLTDVNRVYDGTTDATNALQNAKLTVLDGDDGADVNSLIASDGVNISVTNAEYDSKNAGDRKVTYTLDLTNNTAGNYTLADVSDSDYPTTGVVTESRTYDLAGSGNISKAQLNFLKPTEVIEKEYDGTTAVDQSTNPYATVEKLIDTTKLAKTDTVNDIFKFDPTTATYEDKNAGSDKNVTYDLSFDNTNYELVIEQLEADKISADIDNANGSASIVMKTGKITPRTLNVTFDDVSKVYDGSTDVTGDINMHVDRLVDGDTLNSVIKRVSANYDNANAADSEASDDLISHDVNYELQVLNQNYQLTSNTLQGKGTIERAKLTVEANDTTMEMGGIFPTEFAGNVSGWQGTENGSSDFSFMYDKDSKTSADGTDTYAVWGWYNNRTSGNYGKNYTFTQAAGNATAFKVNVGKNPKPDVIIDPDNNKTIDDVNKEINQVISKDNKFRPDQTSYQQASGDANDSIHRSPSAMIEYHNANGEVVGQLKNDSESVTDDASMSITTSENVVNMDGVDVATTASISVSGTGVNLGDAV